MHFANLWASLAREFQILERKKSIQYIYARKAFKNTYNVWNEIRDKSKSIFIWICSVPFAGNGALLFCVLLRTCEYVHCVQAKHCSTYELINGLNGHCCYWIANIYYIINRYWTRCVQPKTFRTRWTHENGISVNYTCNCVNICTLNILFFE